jgi:branched-chain amino acid transport system permease protein
LFAALFLLALFPLVGTTFYIQLGAKIMIMAIFALSLDLLVGHTGLVSFGHAAYFGVAAYALALMSPKYEAASLWLTLPAALIVAASAALFIGFLVVRTTGIYFIRSSRAQMLYAIFHILSSVAARRHPITIRPIDCRHLSFLNRKSRAVLLSRAIIRGVYVLSKILHALLCALAGIRSTQRALHRFGSLLQPASYCGTIGASRGYRGLSIRFVSRVFWHQSRRPMMVILGHGPAPWCSHRRRCVCSVARISLRTGLLRRLRETLAARDGQFDRAHRFGFSSWRRRLHRCLLAPTGLDAVVSR